MNTVTFRARTTIPISGARAQLSNLEILWDQGLQITGLQIAKGGKTSIDVLLQ